MGEQEDLHEEGAAVSHRPALACLLRGQAREVLPAQNGRTL